ncbi:MAG: hypothetical protein ACUZ77_06195 [Candidatus Brocadiales bacterium]
MACERTSTLAPDENIPSGAKNLFLFGIGSYFTHYFFLNLKNFFTVVECFDTSAIPIHKKYYFMAKGFSIDTQDSILPSAFPSVALHY